MQEEKIIQYTRLASQWSEAKIHLGLFRGLLTAFNNINPDNQLGIKLFPIIPGETH